MKVLVEYADEYYLVREKDGTYDMDDLFNQKNKGRWPDECHDRKMIELYSRTICKLNDEAELM